MAKKKPPPPPLKADYDVAIELYDKIAPMLVGVPSPIQGNLLAMLLGTWLAGHSYTPTKTMNAEEALKETHAMRARLMVVTTNAAFVYASPNNRREAKE